MSGVEPVFYWLAALTAAASFFLMALSVVFRKPSSVLAAQVAALVSLLLITVFGITRWSISGHPPFVTLFESMVMSVWFLLLIYFIVQLANNRLRVLLLPVSLVALLLLGWSSTLPSDPSPLSAALDHVWLFIHASFATSGAAAFLIATSFSILYLLGEEKVTALSSMTEKIPDHAALPKSILNFILLGLILWGVMIVSGSIWANIAWGRYWAWDPIELWSLISWLLYGLILHTRMAWKISVRMFCWLAILASLTVVFSLWGVGYIYETIHSYG
jgi:cytochrome c-type biogenesis protein CcsB